MAKKILLLITILFAITLAAEATQVPKEWTAATKSILDMNNKITAAFDGVNAAAPPEKKSEAERALMMQMLNVNFALEDAKNAGDEKKVVSIAHSYEIAADKVIAASPAEKFKTMEATFNAVVV
ncbi:hypothetical protein EJB05_28556, partial [Eragrostis curvula]